jgi:pimeloyl-ACP methyl ester carboxylesterase
MWTTQVNAMQDFHILNIDLPGNGKSNQREWVSLADTADEIAGIIRQKGRNQRAHVVGLSLGAYVTLTLMERHPGVVDSAFVSGATTRPIPNRWLFLLQMRVLSLFLKSPLMLNLQIKMLNLPAEVVPIYTQNFYALSRQSFLRFANEAVDFRLPTTLRTTSVRVLALAGSREAGLIKDSVAQFADAIPHALAYLVPNVHHGWPGEAPDLCTRTVRSWITNAPLPPELLPVGAGVPQAVAV